jgi:hypothetical protein
MTKFPALYLLASAVFYGLLGYAINTWGGELVYWLEMVRLE